MSEGETITKEQRDKGTRYDNTLTIEGENHAEIDNEGKIRTSQRGGATVTSAGDEVLVERSKNHGISNPCEKYGHRDNGEGSCRFCGSAC